MSIFEITRCYFHKLRILTNFVCINFDELAAKFAKFAKIRPAKTSTFDVINQRMLILEKGKKRKGHLASQDPFSKVTLFHKNKHTQ